MRTGMLMNPVGRGGEPPLGNTAGGGEGGEAGRGGRGRVRQALLGGWWTLVAQTPTECYRSAALSLYCTVLLCFTTVLLHPLPGQREQ